MCIYISETGFVGFSVAQILGHEIHVSVGVRSNSFEPQDYLNVFLCKIHHA